MSIWPSIAAAAIRERRASCPEISFALELDHFTPY